MSGIEQLKREHRSLSNEITNLRKKLGEVNKKKEFWFEKKEGLKKEIFILIQEIKTIKSKNDRSNITVSDLKKERDKYNSHMKNLITQLKRLNKEKREIYEKYKLKEDPYKIQAKIEAIERRIETETSFENEKRLMKQLNELKKVYGENKIKELLDKIDKLTKELERTKSKSNDFHNRLKNALKEKGEYSEFMGLTRKINDIRALQQEAFNNFIMHKKEFVAINNQLNTKLTSFSSIKSKINTSEKSSQRKNISELLRNKTKNVLEKIRNKKKLTTEDLLVLQGESE